MEPVYAQIELQNLHCHAQNDQNNPNNPAEPYLWVVFFKVDGNKAEITESMMLKGTASVFPMSGDHGDLHTGGIKAGEDVRIPAELGLFRTVVTPIALKNPEGEAIDSSGFLGCVVLLMEQDNSLGFEARYAHEALNRKSTEVVNQVIPFLYIDHPRLSDPEIDVITEKLRSTVGAALKDRWGTADIYGLRDHDDLIGVSVLTFSQQELTNKGGMSIGKRLTKAGEDWELTGHASARSAKDIVDQAFLEALGRHPTENELSLWITALPYYQADLSTVQSVFTKALANVTSLSRVPKWKAERRGMITRSYQEAFGREPSNEDIDSWVNSIQQHPITYRTLVNQHVTWLISPAGEGEIVQVVKRAFDVYDRVPTTSELDRWSTEIRNARLTFVQLEAQLSWVLFQV